MLTQQVSLELLTKELDSRALKYLANKGAS